MFCKNCGKQIADDIRFCDACGEATATGGSQAQNSPPQPQQNPQTPYQQPSQTSENTKVFSILAYIGPLFLVGLLAEPSNQKVKFHVNQGFILFIAEVILGIAVTIVNIILGTIPIIALFLPALISLAQFAATITLTIIGIMNASKGEEKQLPYIGNFVIIK